MNLLKAELLLSALVVLSEAGEESGSIDWEKWLECTHIGARASAQILRRTIPAMRVLYQCIDFEPLRDPEFSQLRLLKNIYKFLKLSVYDKQSCLLDPLKGVVNTLEPYVERINSMHCLDS
ncbi:accessory gland protein Acp53Ea-like [Drosophila miranda]|uniref:accessory gland protein Acp53Ea-like n=1 Tax=Drosophila miranda TaxID=7229 RepID=UPI00143F6A67|nr:accessory gland protein Acp53Ea-like [Drosophila miranda]